MWYVRYRRIGYRQRPRSPAQANGRMRNRFCRVHQIGQPDAFVGSRPLLVNADIARTILNGGDAKPLLNDVAVADVAQPAMRADVRLPARGDRLSLGERLDQYMIGR